MTPRIVAHTPYAEWPISTRQSCFPLLELPAKLRNNVYSFAIEEPMDEDKDTAYLIKQNTTIQGPAVSRSENIQSVLHDWIEHGEAQEQCRTCRAQPNIPITSAIASPRRQFHALTQVCGVIRREFRPVYVAQNEVLLHANDSAEYANMIVETGMPDSVAPEIVVE
ncbi:hypothetical protein BU23DRAFT_565534 [Bimuria novae-zelandiae CBS 107.79]|uniref:Uncharacterized protein n=1 Tax=Bimuria novae-zelandiae CBS 107.79 TaxID=1447943 RepID=A0A6A5VI25_9PLEO|nr:hypothetical protein BU23DRAFT_565534 [Bimuria novae-zelandiae CBS 107.79]